MKSHGSHTFAFLVFTALTLGLFLTQTAFAGKQPPYLTKPLSVAMTPDAASQAAINSLGLTGGPVSIPFFVNSFILPFDGSLRTYHMVGRSPFNSANNGTTTVPVVVIPLQIIFDVDQFGNPGVTLDGNNQLANVENSPLFQKANYISGKALQYGDAIQRGSFWNVVQANTPNWHTNVGSPSVGATQVIEVPAANGFSVNTGGQFANFGLMDIGYFDAQLTNIINGLNLDPNTLPVFLSDDVFLFFGTSNNCCVIGFHSAFGDPSQVNTFLWGSWIASGLFGGGFQDITGLSHELSEWYADPFIDNLLPPWNQPGGAPCSNDILEVGDAVEALRNPVFTVKSSTTGALYHPEDEAFVSFFTQDIPSIGIFGRYSFTNELSGPATYCSR